MHIAFVSDFARLRVAGDRVVSLQTANLRWLMALFGVGEWPSTRGMEVSTVTAPTTIEALAEQLADRQMLERYRQTPEQAWAACHEALPPGMFDHHLQQLLQADLVIGFEIPPFAKRFLHARNRTYISFNVGAVRFLSDLGLACTTNSVRHRALLASLAVSEQSIRTEVRRLQAKFARGDTVPLVPPGLPVLIGQSSADAVLVKDGRFATWRDHADELQTGLLSKHDEVIFLEHPNEPVAPDVIDFLTTDLRKTVLLYRHAGYKLIFSSMVLGPIVTLSSSLGVEACWAGREVRFLLKNPAGHHVDEVDLPSIPLAGHGIFSSAVWDAILNDGNSPVTARCGRPFELGADFVRGSLESWAFSSLRSDGSAPPVTVDIFPTASRYRGRLARDMLESPTQARAGAAGLPLAHTRWGSMRVHAAALDVGDELTVDFRSGFGVERFSGGFHNPEPWGVWCNGEHGRFSVSLVTDEKPVSIQVRITFRLFEAVAVLFPVIEIKSARKVIAYMLFRTSTPLEQTAEFQLVQQSRVVDLEFNCDASVAASLMEDEDHRRISFGVVALEVRAHVLSEAAPRDPMPLLIGAPGAGAGRIEISP